MAANNPSRPGLNKHIEAPLVAELWIEPPTIENGCVKLAGTPGLGVP